MIFILILVIYVAVTYRVPLGPLPDYLQFNNQYGYAAVAVMPISLVSSTLFSEAMWQRCVLKPYTADTRQELDFSGKLAEANCASIMRPLP